MATMSAQTALPNSLHRPSPAQVPDGAERKRLLVAQRASHAATERAQLQLAHQATHDAVTGLLNLPGWNRRSSPSSPAGRPPS